jgi:hypothetical protein
LTPAAFFVAVSSWSFPPPPPVDPEFDLLKNGKQQQMAFMIWLIRDSACCGEEDRGGIGVADCFEDGDIDVDAGEEEVVMGRC